MHITFIKLLYCRQPKKKTLILSTTKNLVIYVSHVNETPLYVNMIWEVLLSFSHNYTWRPTQQMVHICLWTKIVDRQEWIGLKKPVKRASS